MAAVHLLARAPPGLALPCPQGRSASVRVHASPGLAACLVSPPPTPISKHTPRPGRKPMALPAQAGTPRPAREVRVTKMEGIGDSSAQGAGNWMSAVYCGGGGRGDWAGPGAGGSGQWAWSVGGAGPHCLKGQCGRARLHWAENANHGESAGLRGSPAQASATRRGAWVHGALNGGGCAGRGGLASRRRPWCAGYGTEPAGVPL